MIEPRERDERGRFVRKGANERYDVAVWNIATGDHMKQYWGVTYEEAEEVRERYADDPEIDVVVEDRF